MAKQQAKPIEASPRDQVEVVAQDAETKAEPTAKKPPKAKVGNKSNGKMVSRSAAAAQRETVQQPGRTNS